MAEHRVAVVTGAASGVGAACARTLSARGWRVAINYRGSAEAAAAVAMSCRTGGSDALAVQGDVAVDADCRRVVAAAVAEWGRVDALVNAAGTTRFVPHVDMDAITEMDWQRIFAVNVMGAFQVARAAAPHLRASGRGSIVNISSVSGSLGDGSCIPYAASKGALDTLTKSLARALAPEVRVNAVCPDYLTGRWLMDGVGAERYEQVLGTARGKAPLGDVATPEDVADAVAWLIEGGRMITGTRVVIDGGIALGL